MTVLTGDPRPRIWGARDALLGARHRERWTFDLLDTNDRAVRSLDRVQSCSLDFSIHTEIRSGGSMEVSDPHLVDWHRHRVGIRYEYTDEAGVDHEHPLGVFLPTTPTTDHSDFGRAASVDLYDKMILLSQDVPESTWTVDAGTTVVQAVTEVLASVGESTGVQRTNLHPNPEVASLQGMYASPSEADLTYTGSAARWTILPDTILAGANVGDENRDLIEGRTYTLLTRARASRDMEVGVRIAGSQSEVPIDRVELTAEWGWHRSVGIAEDGTFRTGFLTDENTGHSAGDWIEIDRVLIVEGDYEQGWFPGTAILGETKVSAPDDGGGALTREMSWEPGDNKLRIVNDILEAGAFFSIWVDGAGMWRLDPYVEPARRGVSWEHIEGANAVFGAEFTHEADGWDIPNAVKIVGRSERDEDGNDLPAPFATAMNQDPEDPFSIPGRGRAIWLVEEDQDATGTDALGVIAARRLLEASSITSTFEIEHAWLPLDLNSAVRLTVPSQDVRALCVLQSWSWSWSADDVPGLAGSTLREVKE